MSWGGGCVARVYVCYRFGGCGCYIHLFVLQCSVALHIVALILHSFLTFTVTPAYSGLATTYLPLLLCLLCCCLCLLRHLAQVVPRLGGSLPVFIESGEGTEWEEPAEALDDLFLGDAEIW